MLVDKEFLNGLRQSFNLNLYEVKLWTALLSRGISTAGELSDMSDVPRSRAYDVLESLERKGFVVIKTEKPIKYIAISPGEVLDRVKRRVKRDAEQTANKLDSLSSSDVLSELKQLYEQGIEPMSATDFSGALKGRHNIYDHLAMIIKEAEKNINIMTTSDGFIRKVRSLKSALEKAAARGVEIRIAAPLNDSSRALIDSLGSLAKIKNVTRVSARFCVVDGKQMIFMLLDDKETHPTYDLAMWVNTPYFASAMANMFDQVWENSAAVVEGKPIGGGAVIAPVVEASTGRSSVESSATGEYNVDSEVSTNENAYNEVTNISDIGGDDGEDF